MLWKECPEILTGHNNRKSNKEWPKPSNWINIWRKFLTQYIIPHLRQNPLGRQINTSHQKWTYFCNKEGTLLKIENAYYKRSSKRILYSTQDHENEDFSVGVDVTKINDGYKINGKNIRNETSSVTKKEDTRWKVSNWGTASLTTEKIKEVKIALENNNLAVASDGSVLAGKGAYAFCLVEDDTYEIIMQGAGPVDGNPNYITSFRSEAFGALAAVTLIEYISEKYNIRNKTIRMYIDNTETISTIKQKKNLNSTSMVISDHIDIALELSLTVKRSSHIYLPEHVKSHDSGEITRAQELNEEMDALVGSFIRQPPPRLFPSSNAVFLPSQEIAIVHRDEYVEVDIENILAQNLFNKK